MAFDAGDETKKLDDYLRDNAGLVGEIATALRMGVIPKAELDGLLDDMVHEAADNISPEASEWASEDVNNSHLERQVAFILAENGKAEGRAAIETAAADFVSATNRASSGPR